jgi:hypothetical protein
MSLLLVLYNSFSNFLDLANQGIYIPIPNMNNNPIIWLIYINRDLDVLLPWFFNTADLWSYELLVAAGFITQIF